MVIVYVLLLGVLQCSTNRYTVWNQGVNYVDGARHILCSNEQKCYCKAYFQCIGIIPGRIHRNHLFTCTCFILDIKFCCQHHHIQKCYFDVLTPPLLYFVILANIPHLFYI